MEESLRSVARSVAAATNTTDMAQFVGSLFDATCKFVAEPGLIDLFMIGGDVRGSWNAAPAQLSTRLFFSTISPDVFIHACTSRLLVNDELHSRPVGLFFYGPAGKLRPGRECITLFLSVQTLCLRITLVTLIPEVESTSF